MTKKSLKLQRIREENRKKLCDSHKPDMSDYTKLFAWIPDVINSFGRDLGRVIWFRSYYSKNGTTMMPRSYEQHYRMRKGALDWAVIRDARLRGENV